MSKPSDLVQGTLDMLLLKILALEPMNGFATEEGRRMRLEHCLQTIPLRLRSLSRGAQRTTNKSSG